MRNTEGEYRTPEADRGKVVSLAAERNRRIQEAADKAAYEEVRRAGGDARIAQRNIDARLKEVRDEIDRLTQDDPKLREEARFLSSQRIALSQDKLPEVSVSLEDMVVEPPKPIPVPVQEPKPSLFGRMKSGWEALKARFTPPVVTIRPERRTNDVETEYERVWTEERRAQAEMDRRHEMQSLRRVAHERFAPNDAPATSYEKTWTRERLQQREPDREREMDAVQERAVDRVHNRLVAERTRLTAVNQILKMHGRDTRQEVVDRYRQEKSTLEARVKDSERLLRIAEAAEARQEQLRKQA